MADPITIPLAVSSDVWLPYTAGVVAKGTLLLAVVFATAAMLRRTSASARHLVWSIGLAAVLALPILSATLPLRFEVLPSGADRWNALVDGFGSPAHAGAAADRSTAGPDSRKSDEEEDDASTRGALAVASDAAPAERGGGGPLRITGESDPAPEVRGFDPEPTTSDAVAEGSNSSDLAATSGVGPGAAEHGDRPAAAERSGAGDRGAGVTPLLVLLGLWAAGALVLLGRMAVGSVAVRRIARRAEPPTSSAWTRPFYEAADRLDLERLPRLLIADAVPLPFTFGLLRPTIVLPGGARSWTDERRRAVLLHELGHIRRRDLWSHLVGRLACAVYWFHPLVWIAAGRARAESERACDDLVLRTGTRASSYADHLLQIVRGASRSRVPAAAIPMAQRNEFEGRMLAILEPDVPRESPGRAKSAALVVGVAALTLAVSAMAPASETAASAATESDDIVTAAGDAAAMVPRDEGEAARQEVPRATDPDRGGGTSIAPDEDATSPTAATDASTERPNADSGVASGVDETTPATPDPNAGTSRSDERARPADAGALAADTPTTTRRPIELRTGVHVESAMERAMAAAYAWADPDWIDDVVGHALDGAWSGLHGVAPAPVPEPRAFGFDDPLDLDFDFEVEQPERAVPLSSWNGRRAPADSATVRALIGALSDTEPEVRRIAAHGLGEIGDPAAVEALSRVLLEDDEATVRWMAALSLGEIEDPAAVPALSRALLEDDDASVRRRAAWTLGEIEDGRALDALGAAAGDEDEDVVRNALWAIGEIGSPAGAPRLEAALVHSNAEARGMAAWAYGELEPETAPPALIATLDDESEQARRMAAWALGEIGDPAAADALTAALADDSDRVRRAALWALGEIGGDAARDALIQAIQSDDPEIRKLAAHALAETY